MEREIPACTEEDLPEPPEMTAETIAAVARALAHPARVDIVDQFVVCTPHIVQEIVDATDLAQSTVSEHLRILRDAQVLFVREDGPRHWYCLRRSVLREFARAVEHLAADALAMQPRPVPDPLPSGPGL